MFLVELLKEANKNQTSNFNDYGAREALQKSLKSQKNVEKY